MIRIVQLFRTNSWNEHEWTVFAASSGGLLSTILMDQRKSHLSSSVSPSHARRCAANSSKSKNLGNRTSCSTSSPWFPVPRCSMPGIFTYKTWSFQMHIDKYAIHGVPGVIPWTNPVSIVIANTNHPYSALHHTIIVLVILPWRYRTVMYRVTSKNTPWNTIQTDPSSSEETTSEPSDKRVPSHRSLAPVSRAMHCSILAFIFEFHGTAKVHDTYAYLNLKLKQVTSQAVNQPVSQPKLLLHHLLCFHYLVMASRSQPATRCLWLPTCPVAPQTLELGGGTAPDIIPRSSDRMENVGLTMVNVNHGEC